MEAYQVLNKELILKVRDLRKEKSELCVTVNAQKDEILQLKTENSSLRKKLVQKCTEFTGFIQEFMSELCTESPKKDLREEMRKSQYSVHEKNDSLPRSPEKPSTSSYVNVDRRRKISLPDVVTENPEDDGIQDMSLEDMQEWLNGNQIDLWKPEEKIEEAAPEIEVVEQEAEVVASEDIGYKNMTTIAEESTQSSQSLLNVTKFASSTPHSGGKLPIPVTTLAVSPIEFNRGTLSASMLRKSPIGAVAESSTSTDENTVLPKEAEKVTKRRGKIFMKNSDFYGFEEEASVPSTSTEISAKDDSQGFEKVTVRRGRKPPAVREELNYEERPEVCEVDEEAPKKVTVRQKRPKTPQMTRESETPDVEEAPEEERVVTKCRKPKKTPARSLERTKLADRTNLLPQSPAECPRPIKVEDLENIVVESQRPKRRAAPNNLAEPRLGTKLRRT